MPTPNPTTRREYKGAAAATTLQNSMTNTDTSFVLVAANNWPTGAVGKFIVTVNRGQADEEKILCDTQTSRTVACQLANRGFDGTTAQAHAPGATVECTISAFDADEWNQHTNATAGVHGVAGSVVGTNDTQTLTNKTYSAPTVSGVATFPGGSTVDAAGQALFLKPYFAGYNTTQPSIATATWTTVAFSTYAQQGFSYAGGGSSRVTAPTTGKYRVSAGCLWALNATGTRGFEVRKNSAGAIGTGTGLIHDGRAAMGTGGTSLNPSNNGSITIPLTAGDYVEMFLYQDSGGSLAIFGTDPLALHLELELVSV